MAPVNRQFDYEDALLELYKEAQDALGLVRPAVWQDQARLTVSRLRDKLHWVEKIVADAAEDSFKS